MKHFFKLHNNYHYFFQRLHFESFYHRYYTYLNKDIQFGLIQSATCFPFIRDRLVLYPVLQELLTISILNPSVFVKHLLLPFLLFTKSKTQGSKALHNVLQNPQLYLMTAAKKHYFQKQHYQFYVNTPQYTSQRPPQAFQRVRGVEDLSS